ncbi:hypothetical protein NLG97_g2283 [Lecanicillium saksenae]|uniref:Uncharacterized protein n=1 Tax=Lecanicillium saksenae TaxID=468837 RepID=A0ACC1R375_9HYPO|nr:hypothetical protein NLG97_g2283 [Lecanicillium saksenae]
MKSFLLFLVALIGLAVAEHWAPSLRGLDVDKDDGIVVYWMLDVDNFPDAEAPDGVAILMNNAGVAVKGATSTQATIERKTWENFRGMDVIIGVMYYWVANGAIVDQKVSSFTPAISIPRDGKPAPPQKPLPIVAPSNLRVTSFEKHHLKLEWQNNPQYPTSKYGKILVRIAMQGQDPQQFTVDGGATTYTWGPVEPNRKIVISVKGGYSYVWGYDYTSWSTVTYTSPGDVGEPIVGWHPWFPINPGKASFVPGSDITATWGEGKYLHLFAVDQAGCVRNTWWNPDTYWDPNWYCLALWTGGTPGNKVAHVWSKNYSHMHLFVTGADRLVYIMQFDKTYDPKWSPSIWTIKGQYFFNWTPITAMWDEAETELQVYAIDGSGYMHVARHHYLDFDWSDWWWQDMPKNHLFEPAGYVTAVRRGGVNWVLAIDGFGKLMYSHGTTVDNWSDWTELVPYDSKNFNYGGKVQMHWVNSFSQHEFYVIATDRDGVSWQIEWDGKPGSLRKNWTAVASGIEFQNDAIMDVYETKGTDRVHLWAMGTDARLYRRAHYQSTSWFAFDEVRWSDQVTAKSKFTPLYSQNDDPRQDHTDVYLIGKDGNVWTTWHELGYYE